MELRRLESATGNSAWGGVLCVFADRSAVELTWQREAPVIDTLAAAKALAARLVDRLLSTETGRAQVASLNLPSVVAALQRHLADWNDARRAALYQQPAPSAQRVAVERRDAAGLIDQGAARDQGGAIGAAQRADSGPPGPGEEPRFH